MLCEFCKSNETILNKDGKSMSRFCSKKCRSSYTCAVRKQTNIEKYGVDNPFKSKEIQAKRDATCLKKYGVAKVSDSPEEMAKIKKKQIETCRSKYGVDFAQQHHTIKEKMKQSWSKYEGSHPFSDPVCRNKRENALLEKFGVKHPILSPDIALKCRSGYVNTMANRRKEKIESYPELNDVKWLEEKINELGCVGVAALLGVSTSIVRERVNTLNIKLPNKRRSIFEKQISAFIETNYSGEIILNSKELGTEIDILLPELKLAIECNGTYWHSELNGRYRDFHINKTKICNSNGYKLIHVWDYDWIRNTDIIKSRIKSYLKTNKTIGARKCVVKEVPPKVAQEFLFKNHIQGSCQSAIRLGLYYNQELVSLMTFGKSRYNKKIEFELLRYVNMIDHSIVGGASKLFKYFVKKFQANSVISYSDKSFNTGMLYQTLGFKWLHTSPPAYHYTKNYSFIESRIKFQKHKLKKLFEDFDSNLSEWENMQRNGYDRIWDCGNDVWLWQSFDQCDTSSF